MEYSLETRGPIGTVDPLGTPQTKADHSQMRLLSLGLEPILMMAGILSKSSNTRYPFQSYPHSNLKGDIPSTLLSSHSQKNLEGPWES